MTVSSFSSPSIIKALAIITCLFSHLSSAQNGDGGAASGNIPSTASNGDAAGAQGPSQSSANISTGATIAIAVIVAIVVVLGILTAILFWQAKKRQWTIRETLRRSTKRVTTGIRRVTSPLTPHRMTFSPLKTRFDDEDMHKLRSKSAATAAPPSFSRRDRDNRQANNKYLNPYQADLEKGPAATSYPSTYLNINTNVAPITNGHNRGPSNPRPKAPMIRIPSSSKKIEHSPQTPMWAKFLGRT